MRLYFRDTTGDVRCVEGEFPHTVDDQNRLRVYVNASTNLNPVLPLLEPVNVEAGVDQLEGPEGASEDQALLPEL